MTRLIGTKARIPNDTLQALAFLVGEWRTEGTHPKIAGQILHGRSSFAWHEGGAFLIMRSQIDHPLFPDGVAIIGSDNEARRIAMTYFDERGVSRLLEVDVGVGAVTWRHEGTKLAQSLTIKAEGHDQLVSRGRMAEDGGPWGDDLSQVFSRA